MIEYQPIIVKQKEEVRSSSIQELYRRARETVPTEVREMMNKELAELNSSRANDYYWAPPVIANIEVPGLEACLSEMLAATIKREVEEAEEVVPPNQQLINVSQSLGASIVVTRPYLDIPPGGVEGHFTQKKNLTGHLERLDLAATGSYRHMVFSHELPAEVLEKIKSSNGIKHLSISI